MDSQSKFMIVIISCAVFALWSCFMTMGGCAREGEKTMVDESGAIIAETQAFAEAWNKTDTKAAASFYTEDGVRVGAFGDLQRGRAEIEAAYDRLLRQTMAGAKVKQDVGTVRMLTQDLAVWQGAIEIVTPGASAPLKGHVVQVMKKVGVRWFILEAHPKLFPPPNTK